MGSARFQGGPLSASDTSLHEAPYTFTNVSDHPHQARHLQPGKQQSRWKGSSVGISKEQIALRAMPPAKAEDCVTLAPGDLPGAPNSRTRVVVAVTLPRVPETAMPFQAIYTNEKQVRIRRANVTGV